MFALIVVALVVCGAFATPLPNTEEGTSRIMGGRTAGIQEFTYQVSLRDSRTRTHFCGASIVDIRWIMTAAHCLEKMLPSDVVVVVGTNFLDSGGKTFYVNKIFIHDDYNPENKANDIALIRVINKIAGNIKGISVVGIAETPAPKDASLVLTGWGLTSYPSTSLSNALQTINLRAITTTQCQALLPEFEIFPTNLCTYNVAGQGACKGDFGSPLVYNGMQYGIVSWGIPCAKGNPDVFTNVVAYRDWIRKVANI